MTSTPTRPVNNVVITTKGLQDRNIHTLDGTTVENKGKLILTKIEASKTPAFTQQQLYQQGALLVHMFMKIKEETLLQ